MGCHIVFAQAHRPQANGRAESAGKVLRDIMRKLYLEEARSWLFLLPLAIRIRHDTVDPELGYSPYHLVFGRERARFGLPWPVVRESIEAKDWIHRLECDRKTVHDRLSRRIDAQSYRESSSRPERLFMTGDRVWLKRPRGITGPGLQTVWLGPYRIAKQVGEHSFEIEASADRRSAHSTQLKVCVETGEGEAQDMGAVVLSC